MELIATAASPVANSYVTLLRATALLQGRLHLEPWTAGEDFLLQDTQALLWATRLLDEQVAWDGVPSTQTQALAWPMTGQVDVFGRPLSSTTIPTVIELATALYALALRRDTSEDPGMLEQGYLTSVRVGDTQLVFRAQGLPTAASRTLPAEIRSLLLPYGTMSGGVNIPLLRV